MLTLGTLGREAIRRKRRRRKEREEEAGERQRGRERARAERKRCAHPIGSYALRQGGATLWGCRPTGTIDAAFRSRLGAVRVGWALGAPGGTVAWRVLSRGTRLAGASRQVLVRGARGADPIGAVPSGNALAT